MLPGFLIGLCEDLETAMIEGLAAGIHQSHKPDKWDDVPLNWGRITDFLAVVTT